MLYSRILFTLLATALTLSAPGFALEPQPQEEPMRARFVAAYNYQRAEQRLKALSHLEHSKSDRSLETLYFVSWQDADPEVRSRAFSVLVHCDDPYGYTAYLAADSFRQEKELGVKVEKAVELGSLTYKWSALNELVGFLRTLRWNNWNWGYGYGKSGGYIAKGTPPPDPADPYAKKEERTQEQTAYDNWRNREPLRWRSENELIALVAGTINRLSGTQIESRPRVDQEIVKWWERKSDLWDEYDRKMRARTLTKSEFKFKELKDVRVEDVKPGKDTLRDLLAGPKELERPAGPKELERPAKEAVVAGKPNLTLDDEE